MLFIIVEMKIKEGCMEEFLKYCETFRPKVLAEEGCAGYDYTRPVSRGDLKTVEDPNTITLIERWETEESFLAHGQMPHMAEFAEVAKRLRESVSVTVHRPVFE